MALDTLLIATHNQGKVVEFQKMLGGLGVTLKSAADFGLPEPEETEKTFVGNALLKARAAMEATGLPTLADDSGLCVVDLDDAPGIYSARWAETPQGRDFDKAMKRVHKELNGIDGTQKAYFIAVLALMYPDGRQEIFEGRVQGTLCWPPRGSHGHGYDPIFIPEGHYISFGEMAAEQKNAMSHRAVAVEKFLHYMQKNA